MAFAPGAKVHYAIPYGPPELQYGIGSGTSGGTFVSLMRLRANKLISDCCGVWSSCLLCSPSLIQLKVECRYNLASTSDRPEKKACYFVLLSGEGAAGLPGRRLERRHPSWAGLWYSTTAL